MAISFNTSNTATVTSSATASGTIAIPAGVLNGDLILVLVEAFTTATGTLTNTLSSTATAPVKIAEVSSGTGGGAQQTSTLFKIAATGSDAGATLTYSTSGGTGGNYWYSVGLVAYTGATGGVDVVATPSGTFGTSLSPVTSPTVTTLLSGDWQVQLMAISVNGGTTITTPGALTFRAGVSANSGVEFSIADSAASVGGAGTTIGGTSWTFSNSASQTWTGLFTVGIAPALAGTVQPRATVLVPRRRLARAYVPLARLVAGGNAAPVAVAAPQQLPVFPRRRPARAYVRFTPVTTTNGAGVAGVAGTVPVLMVNQTRVIVRRDGRVVRQ